MVGSPNYVRFVYDGDLSDTESDVSPPPGSAQIETLFNQYFAGQGMATDPAGEPYDPCYPAACDTIGNLSTAALNEMSDGAAHATLTLAKSKSGFFEDGSRVGKRQKTGKKFSPRGHEHR